MENNAEIIFSIIPQVFIRLIHNIRSSAAGGAMREKFDFACEKLLFAMKIHREKQPQIAETENFN